jgi:hypothetical protein
MRRGVVDVLALAGVLAIVCSGYGQPSPKPKADDKEKKTPAKSKLDEMIEQDPKRLIDPGTGRPAKTKLEEMLEQALQNNPDIAVAEAKLREAEAKLSRTRLEVTQRVAILYAAIESARVAVGNAEAELDRATILREKGTISLADFGQVRQQAALAKANLAKLQAEAAYLLGKPPGEKTANTDKAVERGLRYLSMMKRARDEDSAAIRDLLALSRARIEKAAGPMSDRIRKALDKPMKLNYRAKTSGAILHDLFAKVDVPLLIAVKLDATGQVVLESNEDLPLGAALQMFQDLSPDRGIRFVVRDYGVLVTDVKQLPDGAVLLHDFWKSKPLDPKKGDDSAKNPPPENVEGLVKDVDKSGLVKITIGSDAGLTKSHTLEVFRVKKDVPPKYLGVVRIVEVTAKEAVGQPVGKLTAPIEVGDSVASRILGK